MCEWGALVALNIDAKAKTIQYLLVFNTHQHQQGRTLLYIVLLLIWVLKKFMLKTQCVRGIGPETQRWDLQYIICRQLNQCLDVQSVQKPQSNKSNSKVRYNICSGHNMVKCVKFNSSGHRCKNRFTGNIKPCSRNK